MVSFQRTLRVLAQERKSTSVNYVLLGTLGLLLIGWFLWLVGARIPLYEVSASARIVTSNYGQPVETLREGRIANIVARLGQAVHAGDVLFELDSTVIRRKIEGAQAELRALQTQLQARQSEVSVTEQLLVQREKQAEVNLRQAQARRDRSRAALELAEYTFEKRKQLLEKGVVSDADYVKTRNSVEQERAGLRADELEVDRLSVQKSLEQNRTRAHIAKLKGQTAELEALIAQKRANLGALHEDLENLRVRATSDGVVGELADVRSGSVVEAGARLATIVPEGRLRIVAEFNPAQAIGLIAPGQDAQVRLDGFPSTQYGTLPAKVVKIAAEIRDGTVRVELAIDPAYRPVIPLQHGQPGKAEIVVAQVSPLQLIVHMGERVLRRSGPARPLPVRTTLNESAT